MLQVYDGDGQEDAGVDQGDTQLHSQAELPVEETEEHARGYLHQGHPYGY
jgi:hypothetical protein